MRIFSTASVGAVVDMKMSPTGDLLAVAGSGGLQMFHFDGSGAITPYTGHPTGDEIDQIFWDNQGHLYALSRPAGKLYVFIVTASGYAHATGSPYVVDGAQGFAVDAMTTCCEGEPPGFSGPEGPIH